MGQKLRCGIIGYGPVFNWGWMHARRLAVVPEFELVGICDRDEGCAARARADWPEVPVYLDLEGMIAEAALDVAIVVTQHNTHCALTVRCLQAGLHTVVEKPMCLSVAEADRMIAAAEAAGRTLAVYHNRRHDGNVRLIHKLVGEGRLGEVFQVEVCTMGYGLGAAEDGAWRANKAVSGGGLYDWGAHAVDWVLSMVPSPVAQVTGFFRKFGGAEAANEDHTRAIVRFENGCAAEICWSRAARLGKPYLWYVLGTEGAILDCGHDAIRDYCQEVNGPSGGELLLRTAAGDETVPYLQSDWGTYYHDLADHLLRGAPVPVSAQDGRRVIAVLQTAELSSQTGRSEALL